MSWCVPNSIRQILKSNFSHNFFSPMNIDLIEPNLYLGSRPGAQDFDILKKNNITHILTVSDIPLPEEIAKNRDFTIKSIFIEDEPTEMLVNHLDDTYTFISEGLSNGATSVHCIGGVSRSSSVVIAFIMKKYQLTYEEAFEKVKERRNLIRPNPGFVSQLRLYQKMEYKVDSSNENYKTYRLQHLANHVCKMYAVLQDCGDIIQDDPALVPLQEESKAYCCKKCRRMLAKASDLIPHEISGKMCANSYFVMPVAWMNVTKSIQNKLYCPECKSEVGSFNWTDGVKCPCDIRQVPAFCLTPSKVDFITPSK